MAVWQAGPEFRGERLGRSGVVDFFYRGDRTGCAATSAQGTAAAAPTNDQPEHSHTFFCFESCSYLAKIRCRFVEMAFRDWGTISTLGATPNYSKLPIIKSGVPASLDSGSSISGERLVVS